MTDTPAQPPTTLRVHCLHGAIYDLSTPLSFDAFVKCVKADRQLAIASLPGIPGAVIVPYHSIGEFRETTQVVAQAKALAQAPPEGSA